jgi:hypothetical protein
MPDDGFKSTVRIEGKHIPFDVKAALDYADDNGISDLPLRETIRRMESKRRGYPVKATDIGDVRVYKPLAQMTKKESVAGSASDHKQFLEKHPDARYSLRRRQDGVEEFSVRVADFYVYVEAYKLQGLNHMRVLEIMEAELEKVTIASKPNKTYTRADFIRLSLKNPDMAKRLNMREASDIIDLLKEQSGSSRLTLSVTNEGST